MTSTTAKFEPTLRKRTKGRAIIRDKEATIAAILSAAEMEFARYGLQGGRVEKIARGAGVTKGLIFHYFENKEHLFEAVLHRASAPLRSVMLEVEISTDPPIELLFTLIDRFLVVLSDRPLSHLMYTLESIQNNAEHYRKLNLPSLYRTIEHVLERGMAQGCFCQLDPKHAAINIVGICSYFFTASQMHPDPELRNNPFDKEKFARHMIEARRFIRASITPHVCPESHAHTASTNGNPD